VNAAVQEALLDTDQQVIGQHAQEDVGLGALLELMKDRPLHQRALKRAEGGLHAAEQSVDAPELRGAQILAVGLDQIGAVQLRGAGFAGAVLLPKQLGLLGVILDAVVTRHPG
jgi:hypothetical protein